MIPRKYHSLCALLLLTIMTTTLVSRDVVNQIGVVHNRSFMGYNFVGTTDLLQGGKEGVLRVDSVVKFRGSESQESQKTVSVGLELWTLSGGELEPEKHSLDLGFSVMEPPSCGSSKRARAPNAGSQVPSCLVDGCNSDLSKCRDYHRRHKVCELHSKTPKVTIRGQEQRFCQQCSRFHSLGEFDDGKRSCRKRLDGHNRRRRKSQPDTLLSSSHFLANYQGTKFMPVSSTQIFPASAVANFSWGGLVKPENDPMLYGSSSSSSRHQLIDFTDRKMISDSSPHVYRPQFQFPFMTDNRNMSCGSSECEPTLSNHISGNNSDSSSQKMLPNCLPGALSNSDCALSLLSSSLPAAAQGSSHKGMGTMMQFDLTEPSLSTMSTMQYSRVGTGEPMGSFLATPGSLHGMFRSRHDESSASGSQSHHTPSFTWE